MRTNSYGFPNDNIGNTQDNNVWNVNLIYTVCANEQFNITNAVGYNNFTQVAKHNKIQGSYKVGARITVIKINQ